MSPYDKARAIDPKNSKAYWRKGTACFALERYRTALANFECGKRLDPLLKLGLTLVHFSAHRGSTCVCEGM